MDHLAAALVYAEQGMAVFPLAPRSKFPLISTEQGGRGMPIIATIMDKLEVAPGRDITRVRFEKRFATA